MSPSAVRIAIVGPTATGKSELALDLADALTREGGSATGSSGVEVLNADASQLYRGMDIGTAKVPRAEARGARVLIVGGSGLYVRAVTDALEFPGTDPDVRADLEARARREGSRRLWQELRDADPVSAQRIEPGNTRRIVRALEVLAVTGRPFSATLPRYEDLAPTLHLALRVDRAALNARIDARTTDMFDAGLVGETEALMAAGLEEGRTAPNAIGYAQAIDLLRGRITGADAVELTARATRRLASRQIKWFRRDPRIHWLDATLDSTGAWLPGERRRVTQQALRLVEQADEAHAGVA